MSLRDRNKNGEARWLSWRLRLRLRGLESRNFEKVFVRAEMRVMTLDAVFLELAGVGLYPREVFFFMALVAKLRALLDQ